MAHNINMDSDDEWEESEVSYQGISGSVILINCHDPSSLNTAAVSFEATCGTMRRFMRHSNSPIMGVCLYGTKESNTSGLVVNNMKQILPLDTPTLEGFKKLLTEDIATYGQASELKLSDVLWHCSKIFTQCHKKLSERTVVMLTRLDDPPVQSDRRPTLKRVLDLAYLGITVKLINVSQELYYIDPFYEELLQAANKGIEVNIPRPVWKSEEIIQLMQQHTHRHLALAHLSFEIGDGLSIGVGVYKIVKSCSMPKKVKLSSTSNEIVTSSNKLMKVVPETDDTFENNHIDNQQPGTSKETPLLKSEILYYQYIGGEKIEFTHNEINTVKYPFQPPMMKLLGFKPNHVLQKEKWFLKSCSFLFPDENIIEGSTIAFKALHQACIDTSMYALCVLCTRSNSKPNIVALSPCTKPLGLEVDIGFDIIYIPFSENLKEIPIFEDREEIMIDDTHSILMKDVINLLKFKFRPETFENPKLQCLYRAIEALALEEENLQPFVDTTKREESKLQSIDAELFEDVFGPFGVTIKKRPGKTLGKSHGSPAKRLAQSNNIDENLFRTRLANDQVENYTVRELKKILKWKGCPDALTGLKKNKLVELVKSMDM